MTTLDRLFKKGLLTRERVGQAFVYRAALDRDGYRQRLIEAAVGELVDRAPDAVLAAFVDTAAALDEHNLLRLERLIAERKRKPK
jgi:predicted transcriptional regulator